MQSLYLVLFPYEPIDSMYGKHILPPHDSYWDVDWELYSKVENHYEYLKNSIDFDHMDDYICEKILLLDEESTSQYLAIAIPTNIIQPSDTVGYFVNSFIASGK